MSWILLATLGQFFNAIVAVVDKYLVTDKNALPRPFVYAFYSCLITGSWLLVFVAGSIPGFSSVGFPTFSNVVAPSLAVVGMSFLAAYTFFMALVSLYNALQMADASDVMPVIGAVSALSSFGMTYLFLDHTLTTNFIWGTLLLIAGTFLVSQVQFTRKIILYTIHGGLFFALHNIAMKGLFLETSFDDGFFWSRVAFFLFALSLLLVPSYYEKIVGQTKKPTARTGFIVLGAKVLAGVAAFLLLKATDWGEVSVVQALDGLKFVFILLISFIVGRFIPITAGENNFDFRTLVRKAAYVTVIAVGFVILFL
jgi:uncharacterized membrane protein